jgi:hypothetical protein
MKLSTGRIGRWARQQSKLIAAVAVGVAIGGVGPAVVRAAIPDGNTVHGCYTNAATIFNAKGTIQVIDTATTPTCPTGTTALNWDKTSTGGTTVGGFMPNLVGANFTNASLPYRNFAGVDMHDALLGGSVLTGSDFSGANLSGTSFTTPAKMENTNFHNTNFTNLVITTDSLGMTFSANVSGANFTGASLDKVTFLSTSAVTGTNFTNAQFSRVIFTGVNLTPTTLTGATWTHVGCPDGTSSDNNGNTCIGHLVP